MCVCVQSELDLCPRKVGRVPMVTGGQSVYLPLGMEEQSGSLSPHLQPVLLLEPSRLVHTPMLAGETHHHIHIQCWLPCNAFDFQ
jgi:hypothetical protein